MRAVALVALAACSFTVTSVPASYHPSADEPPPECETSFVGRALLDMGGIAASGSMAMLAYAFSFGDCQYEEPCDRKVSAAAPWLVPIALHVAAIVSGFVKARACVRAVREYRRLQAP